MRRITASLVPFGFFTVAAVRSKETLAVRSYNDSNSSTKTVM